MSSSAAPDPAYAGDDHRDRNSVASVEKAMLLVATIARAGRPMTPAELADASGLSLTAVYRLLRALAKSKAVERLPRGSYVLGYLAQELGTAIDTRGRIKQAAASAMVDLRDGCGGETVGLYTRLNLGQFTCIETLPGYARYRYLEHLDRPIPIACGGTSLVLLADTWTHYGPDFVGRYLRSVRRAVPRLSPTEQIERIEKVHDQRYAVSHGTRLPGMSAIAAPVEDEIGQIVAIITLSAPTVRLNSLAIGAWRPKVTAAAREVAARLAS